MEINLKQLSTNEVEGTVSPRKMRLSADASSMVFQMFTKNVYSNAIGTVVREITSNCFDSHVEAGVNSPVIIKKSIDDNDTMYISFIDFGVGMSPDRIYDIYGVYFESTKRATNTQIGGFGIGGKTPFAYKRVSGHNEYDNSFYVITTYNKTKYVYLMLEGMESPEIALLHSEPTTDRNGTEVRIPILPKDLRSFKKEIVNQLYYFENIIFEGFEINEDGISDEFDEIINNDYKIIRGKSFLFRGDKCDTNIHVCLGRVAYPIDYKNLGLSAVDFNLPIALRFDVGELNVTLSRESLDYSTETAVNLIKTRIEEAISEIKELLIQQYSTISNLEDYFKVKNNYGMLLMPNGQTIYVGNVIKQKDVAFKKFRYSTLSLPNDRELFRLFFDAKLYGKKPAKARRLKSEDSPTVFENSYKHLVERDNLYYCEGPIIRKNIKQSYLKSLHDTRYYVITKRNLLENLNSTRSNISNLFNIYDDIIDINGNPTEYIKTLLDLQEEYFEIVKNYSYDYNDIIISNEFINARKSGYGITDDIKNTTIPVRFVNWKQYRVKLDDLFNVDCPIYYGTRDDEAILTRASLMYKSLYNEDDIVTGYNDYYNKFRKGSDTTDINLGVMFIIISRENIKYMKYCKNAMHINKFKETLIEPKKGLIIEYLQVQKFIHEYSALKNLFLSPEFYRLSPEWVTKISKVKKYIEDFQEISKSIYYSHHELGYYYPVKDIKLTSKQLEYQNIINEGIEMQEANHEVFRYIDIPYNLNNDGFWNIMKKVFTY